MKTIILSLAFLFAISMTACKKNSDPVNGTLLGGGNPSNTLTIINNSGSPVYVYDWDESLAKFLPISPVTGGNPLNSMKDGAGGTLLLTMQTASRPTVDARRIYISDKELNKSLAKPSFTAPPDPFNYNYDATAQYTFVEYNYNDPTHPTSKNSYTIDLSCIDEYSYPVTLKFSNVGSYTGCVEGHEYGFTSMVSVKNALKSISPPVTGAKYAWDALIWPKIVKCDWNSESYPQGMVRIIGPNKVWSENPGSTITQHNVPYSYLPFIQSLPKTGNQLFGGTTASTNNWTGWENWDYKHNPSPSNTGYVKALHSAATADKNGKYGFFCYPKDNTDGEFTNVPDAVGCTITIYSLSN
ncbi:hypothetical protein ACFLS7_00800 [Bacteroidota bacterium]